MNINLFANGTTFGVPYTCSRPHHNFTEGEGHREIRHDRSRLIKSIPVPVKTAYFANRFVYEPYDERDLSGYYNFVCTLNVVHTEMIRLNPDLRFMPAEIFSRCEAIPLKILANRRVAVLVSDNKYQTLGEVGEQNRRQSFYHSNTPRHPELSDERIAELAKLGFFLVPGDDVNGAYSGESNPVFNINRIDGYRVRSYCFDHLISNEQLPEYKHPECKHLVGHDLLQYPIIETGQVSQAAYVSSVYSPTNDNHLLLIRPADTKLPMLQGTELIETKYQAMIDRAVNAGQPTSIKNEGVVKSLREAEFFMAPYQESIRFCQSAIETLNAYPLEHPNLSVAINKAISRLAFSEQYMTDCAGLVRQAIVYDELMQLENTSTMEELKIKQEEISQQFIHKEMEWHKKAVQEEILSGKDSYFPMINMHSLIMTSLGDLLMEMGYRNSQGESALRDKIVARKAEAETLCTQTDELLSDRKTIHSLKLKSISVSIESADAEDDVEKG
ncbi:hypothetical protein [Endozoicomonas sp. GU-1]|uniref:hypothetical protein n=1 Tax=Endozoicomonas sp. GU-1 TaxID=3009078 RepID=UPI0022B553D8|nr:hypothetical protein [Endozoicomonas sp. GU-1]WBA80786.1 hypothetical protein O2T12_21130 [Endozoicomonas sp. GU-1]